VVDEKPRGEEDGDTQTLKRGRNNVQARKRVTVTVGSRVRTDVEHLPNLGKRQFAVDFQSDHLALFGGQEGQGFTKRFAAWVGDWLFDFRAPVRVVVDSP